jgi:hypothetical protein
MSLSTLFFLAAILVLPSCSNTVSNKSIGEENGPPNTVQFSTASTAKPTNNSNGFEVTGTVKGNHRLIQNAANKEIELILDLPTGGLQNKFYWTTKQRKEYSKQNTNHGLLFVGKDDAGAYGEVEYFYDDNNNLNMVVLRSPQNNSIVILNNLLN